MTHLDALNLRLSNERVRFNEAKTPKAKAFYAAVVASCEREIAGELKFLGLTSQPVEMTDDELFNELNCKD